MYSDLESNESKRREVVSSLYWSLMQGWNIPLSIQEYYGLTEDYRLFHQLEGMAPAEEADGRSTRHSGGGCKTDTCGGEDF